MKTSPQPTDRPVRGFVRVILLVATLGSAGALTVAKNNGHDPVDTALDAIESILPQPTPEEHAAALLAAATAGDVAELQDLLEDPPAAPTTAPLIAATNAGHKDIIRALHDHGLDLDAPHDDGHPALVHALDIGNTPAATTLLKLGAEPSTTTRTGEPAIIFATRTKNHALLRALAAGHSDEAPLVHLDTALGTAARLGDLTAANILLDAGASAVPFHTGGPNALDTAVRNGDLAMADLLLDHHGPDLLHTIAPDLLASTVTGGQPDLLGSLLAAGADPDYHTADDHPLPLQLAVEQRDLVATARLLEHCADSTDALAAALMQGDERLLDLLLDHGADAANATADGEPPIFAAVRAGDATLTRRLLEAGADPTATGRENQSALAVAVALRQADVVTELIAAGADPNRRLADPVNEDYRNLIPGADSLKYYLKRDKRFTPIMIAAGAADHATIKTLLANGASRGVYTRSWKRYPVSFAFTSEDIYAQQLMLGRDPEKEDPTEQRKVIISLSQQTATLLKNGEVVATTKVSTGKKSTPTPKGQFVISDKHRHHTSSIYHVAMPYFQRLSGQAFGFHTGYLPGYPASHGCIRMPNSNAKKFFGLTKVGDLVTIVE